MVVWSIQYSNELKKAEITSRGHLVPFQDRFFSMYFFLSFCSSSRFLLMFILMLKSVTEFVYT